ncbi:peptidylprolyl isomerase [Aureibaculum marinum]|uniref:peptidylprolyl isomerase n=1 Tax=Aureibaculum marinum TaxID=2487930 RepID=A0A3N4P8J8_9FLAO|nr:peptidylprolyl isomerase [Aureibaculum marinum]RPE00040.1 peptidylprolyl isomerase [Aureibaculum marinum]
MKPSFYSFLVVIIFVLSSCGSKIIKEKWLNKEAPAIFKARFETTKGNFDIEAHREWSPKAVDRLYQLISTDFYTDIALFRVVPNFVVQFGIHNNAELNNAWSNYKIEDEPVKKSNAEGTIAFARGGKESRTTQLFINLKNNARLDSLFYNDVSGFPVIAKVTEGMDVVKSFYDGYGEKPGYRQDSIQNKGNQYLKSNFPKLDYIKKAYIVK